MVFASMHAVPTIIYAFKTASSLDIARFPFPNNPPSSPIISSHYRDSFDLRKGLIRREDPSQLIKSPPIKAISAPKTDSRQSLTIPTISSSIFSSEFLGQSQLIILIDLRWLQQPTYLGGSLALSLFGGPSFGFYIFGVEFCIVVAEFFE